MRSLVLDPEVLVKAVASGRQKGEQPTWRRAEMRYMSASKAGPAPPGHDHDATQAHTPTTPRATPPGTRSTPCSTSRSATRHVETTTQTHARGSPRSSRPSCTRPTRGAAAGADRGTTATEERLLPEDDPVFVAWGSPTATGGLAEPAGEEYRQVEEFLRLLDASITDALGKGHLRRPTTEAPPDRRPRFGKRLPDLRGGASPVTEAARAADRGRREGAVPRAQRRCGRTARRGGRLRRRHDR